MRILFSAVPAYGHVLPMIPIARAMSAGDEVSLLTHGALRELVGPVPVPAAGPTFDELSAAFSVRTPAPRAGMRTLDDVAESFVSARVTATFDPASGAAAAFQPDLLMAEVGPLVAAQLGLPSAPCINLASGDNLRLSIYQENVMQIAEKTVLVTGANRGVGEALVREALNRGAKKVFAGTRSTLPNGDPRVKALTLDVTNALQIQRAVDEVADLDVLINNAGIGIPEDLTDLGVIQKHLDVNLLGPLKVTQAFLPRLIRSKGAIVNILSIVAVAPYPPLPGYSISKAAGLSLTQSLRALLTRQGVGVHAVILGGVDTDMSRDYDGPKVSPESAAAGILDGLEKGEEDIFPDPTSQTLADGWRTGVAKALERRINAVVLEGAQIDIRERL